MAEKTIALLVAAGKSERMQADLPKPYLEIGGETILRRTVRNFLQHPEIDGVRVVIRREHHAIYKKAVEGLTMFPCVIGGNSRQESVCLGLESIAYREPRYVLVHDIARPLASHALISRVLAKLRDHPAVIPTLAITDTIKRMQDGHIIATINRDHLYTVQTPQGFHFHTIYDAHQALKGESLTDDAALIEKRGGTVEMVEGETRNIKVTTPEDLKRMQALLDQDMETRVGMGYDVHSLHPYDNNTSPLERTIRICGLDIIHSHYLEGHSDADVGLHALVDALLGAMGEGDIGQHFPPGDPQWRGADSAHFLRHASDLVQRKGGAILHLDVTIICEHPKIGPHRDDMIDKIAQIAELARERVSVKATTTEKLGFTGRSEGIAAQAVATIKLPRI